MNENLKDWPEWGLHVSGGFSLHKGFTSLARKARAQMLPSGRIGDANPVKLWVMSESHMPHEVDVNAVMVAVFYRTSSVPHPYLGSLPKREVKFVSVGVRLPLQRRARVDGLVIKRCQDCIEEMKIWIKMELA